MSEDADHLLHEGLVRGDLSIPAVDTIFDENGNDGVQLQIDVVAAGQWR